MRFALPRQLSNKSFLINISSRVSICQSLHLTASVGILPPHRRVGCRSVLRCGDHVLARLSGGSQRDLLFGGAGADIMQAGSEERFWFRDTLRREPEGGTNAQHGAAT